MFNDIYKLIESERDKINEEKKRLGLLKSSDTETQENEHQHTKDISERKCKTLTEEKEKDENLPPNDCRISNLSENEQTSHLVERLDLSSIESSLKRDKLIGSENPLSVRVDDSFRRAMLRYGEYSPNNPHLRVTAAPYLGLGEYEQRRQILQKERRADYQQYIEKNNETVKTRNNSVESRPTLKGLSKAVQTDIQNIHVKLIQYELHLNIPPEKELSPQSVKLDKENQVMRSNRSPILNNRLDQKYHSLQSSLLKPDMDKPRSILSNRKTESPRERLMSDLRHSYGSSFMDGFSYQDKEEEIERERLKRESYQSELRTQIEEKRRLAAMREEQERREQELENRRLEQQLLRMQEEQLRDEQRRNRRDEQIRRHSEELLMRKQEMQGRSGYRKHTDSESSVTCLRNTNVASKQSHYSPPVARRNPYSYNIPSTSVFAEPTSRYNPNKYDILTRKDALNRMDSLNLRDTNSRINSFSRYDSLSRIDSLNRQEALSRLETLNIKDNLSRVQRRHSATQQDLSMLRKSPKPQRRSSSSRFELDSLPIPVLKAHSPVAKELKNSIAVSSSKQTSDAVRRLEDKWQIPAVQKNIINHDLLHEGHGRSILTQLGAIRMQLQQEQLRMDESLRNRSFTTI